MTTRNGDLRCSCGCGEPAPMTFHPKTGERRRFIQGHQSRAPEFQARRRVTVAKTRAEQIAQRGQCRAMTYAGHRCKMPVAYRGRDLCGIHSSLPRYREHAAP